MIDIIYSDAGEKYPEMALKLGISGLSFTGKHAKIDFPVHRIRIIKSLDARMAILKKPIAVFGLELSKRPDFIHHRASGLDQVTARMAAEKGVAIGFAFSSLHSKYAIGRVRQNIKLCRKYKVAMMIASLATHPYEMRAPNDLRSLFMSLGMHPKEAADALAYAENIISTKRIVNGVEYV